MTDFPPPTNQPAFQAPAPAMTAPRKRGAMWVTIGTLGGLLVGALGGFLIGNVSGNSNQLSDDRATADTQIACSIVSLLEANGGVTEDNFDALGAQSWELFAAAQLAIAAGLSDEQYSDFEELGRQIQSGLQRLDFVMVTEGFDGMVSWCK
ncbi:hypothetical protein [Humidisolicoccus flavus]|uniref:hypothetical protein n=1 Tax=Humidisolicoccus flavus TaxID=3111414 RepID=UPI0032483F36